MQSEPSSTPSINSFLCHFPVDIVSTGTHSWSSGQAPASHRFNIMKLSDFGSASAEYATSLVIDSLHYLTFLQRVCIPITDRTHDVSSKQSDCGRCGHECLQACSVRTYSWCRDFPQFSVTISVSYNIPLTTSQEFQATAGTRKHPEDDIKRGLFTEEHSDCCLTTRCKPRLHHQGHRICRVQVRYQIPYMVGSSAFCLPDYRKPWRQI